MFYARFVRLKCLALLLCVVPTSMALAQSLTCNRWGSDYQHASATGNVTVSTTSSGTLSDTHSHFYNAVAYINGGASVATGDGVAQASVSAYADHGTNMTSPRVTATAETNCSANDNGSPVATQYTVDAECNAYFIINTNPTYPNAGQGYLSATVNFDLSVITDCYISGSNSYTSLNLYMQFAAPQMAGYLSLNPYDVYGEYWYVDGNLPRGTSADPYFGAVGVEVVLGGDFIHYYASSATSVGEHINLYSTVSGGSQLNPNGADNSFYGATAAFTVSVP